MLFDEDINLQAIVRSGQCFRFRPENYYWTYAGTQLVQLGSREIWMSDDKANALFYSSISYTEIESRMREHDDYLRRCADFGHGLRILQQPLFETIISYIISQNNNIPRIEGIVGKLHFDREKLLDVGWEELGVGYRAPYLENAVRVCDSRWLSNLHAASDKIAYLKQLKGVGDKVANCIALFALADYSAFPIDVHIQRIINREYGGVFDTTWCKEFAGIVQQYMFYYERWR